MKTLKVAAITLVAVTALNLGISTHQHVAKQKATQQDIACLAKNIYHEARGEPLEGQIAVAQVTLNRVQSGEFQNSVCEVVYANKQFSWTNTKHKKVRDQKAYDTAVTLATAVLTKSIPLPNFKALYFHTRQVKPSWNRKKQVVAVIGNHIFYS